MRKGRMLVKEGTDEDGAGGNPTKIGDGSSHNC